MKTRLSAGCIALMKCPSGKPNPEILIPIITLIPQFVVLHPVLNLLVGHVEVALLLVESGHLFHFLLRQFEVEHLNILLDMPEERRIGRRNKVFAILTFKIILKQIRERLVLHRYFSYLCKRITKSHHQYDNKGCHMTKMRNEREHGIYG